MYEATVKAGTTSLIFPLPKLRDSSTGMGKTGIAYSAVTAYYSIDGATPVAITLASGSVGDAYSSGKFIELSSSHMPGDYAFHVPNAAIASGTYVKFTFTASGMIDCGFGFKLVAIDVKDAAAGGMSRIDVTMSSRAASVTDYVVDTVLHTSTPTSSSIQGTTTSSTDNFYNDSYLVFTGGTLKGIARRISGYTGATRTFAFYNAFPTTPAVDDPFIIIGGTK
jgi:hypothetical protein